MPGARARHSGRWHSKDEAGGLAAEAGLAPRAVVAQALDGRAGGRQPTPAAVYPFLDAAEKELRGLSPALPDGLEQDRRGRRGGVQRLDPAEPGDRNQLVARGGDPGTQPPPSEPITRTARPIQSTSV